MKSFKEYIEEDIIDEFSLHPKYKKAVEKVKELEKKGKKFRDAVDEIAKVTGLDYVTLAKMMEKGE